MTGKPAGARPNREGNDLTAFLNARLDEDEAIAAAAQAPSPWRAAVHESDTWIVTDATGEPLIYDEGTPSLEEAAHIARHAAARVLRDVAAKRAILDRHAPHETAFDGPACDGCSEDVDDRPQLAKERWPCPDVLSLADVWSDHPDYDPGWKP
jgi:Family of unknown function (DUF6221)